MQKYKVGDKVRLKSDHRISDVRGLEGVLFSGDGHYHPYELRDNTGNFWYIGNDDIECILDDEPEYEIHHKLNDRFNNPEILYMSDVVVVYNVNDSLDSLDSLDSELHENYTSADDFWAVYKKVFKRTPATIEAMRKEALFL